jgi:hypothetical protein
MIINMQKSILFLFGLARLINCSSQTITYYKNIQPIIQAKCSGCHKPGESAPFSLLRYDDVAKRASFIKKVVQTKYMPPWKADNKYVHFANDRSLSDEEIAEITNWIDNKTPEGTKTTTTEKPVLAGTMYDRKPDMVLMAKDTFHVKGNNTEIFVVFKIPFELKDSENVEAIEFFSNDKKLIHHANYAIHPVLDTGINIYNTPSFINLSEDDRKKFLQYEPYRKEITYYGGWIPGSNYEAFPKGFGWVMPKRGVILLTVHYAPSPIDTNSISGVNLFFTKTPVQRRVKIISFGSGGIGEKEIEPAFFIKANQVKTFTLDVSNPREDFSIMFVWPHMHYLGKEFTAYVTTPDGDTVKLVHIPAWDFRWQEIYKLKHLLLVPKGSVVHIIGTYDNTASNPFNPNNPPETVWSYGDMSSRDEMMTLILAFLPYQKGDENISLQ